MSLTQPCFWAEIIPFERSRPSNFPRIKFNRSLSFDGDRFDDLSDGSIASPARVAAYFFKNMWQPWKFSRFKRYLLFNGCPASDFFWDKHCVSRTYCRCDSVFVIGLWIVNSCKRYYLLHRQVRGNEIYKIKAWFRGVFWSAVFLLIVETIFPAVRKI